MLASPALPQPVGRVKAEWFVDKLEKKKIFLVKTYKSHESLLIY